jgi:formate dehydrogenase subunit gamma
MNGALGRTVVYENQLLRHSAYTRVLHWLVAFFFVLALLTGLAIYSPWLFRWVTPLFAGGAMTRELHPWFSLAFVAVFVGQIINWLAGMRWTPDDRAWLRHMKAYVTNKEKLEPETVGFFNAGQKLYFWAIVGCSVVFLLTGLAMWFPRSLGRTGVAIGYVLHDVATWVMLAGFIAHVYEATAAQPGTFQSMVRGTVSKAWAWTHHPAWYREVTGRDPREDYERERDARLRSSEDARLQRL